MLLEGAALRVSRSCDSENAGTDGKVHEQGSKSLGKWWGYGVGKMSEAVLAQALCGAMLRRVEYPYYLRARWADIGGIVPPARRETLTGVTETATGGQAESEAVQIGNAASDCTNGPKTWEMEEPKRGEIENSRSGSTSGPLCFCKGGGRRGGSRVEGGGGDEG